MSICSLTEVLTALGIHGTATAQQEALARHVHYQGEQLVKEVISYDPEQASYTELLPTREDLGGNWEEHGNGLEEVISRSTSSRVWFEHWREVPHSNALVMKHLPIRSILTIHEDDDRAFGATTLIPAADYRADFDESGFCRSGIIIRENGSWNAYERTIKVSATCGYTSNEFMTIASPIKAACLMTIVKLFKMFLLQGANSSGGFTAGQLLSEQLDAYRYTLSDGGPTDLSSFGIEPVDLPPEAALRMLEPFIHWARHIII